MVFVQVLKGEKVSLACDVFSYGMVLFEIFKQEIPFADIHDIVKVISMISEGKVGCQLLALLMHGTCYDAVQRRTLPLSPDSSHACLPQALPFQLDEVLLADEPQGSYITTSVCVCIVPGYTKCITLMHHIPAYTIFESFGQVFRKY